MDASSPSGIFLFEGFRLDLRNGGLFRCSDDGAYVPVGIGSRALEVLGLLIERQGDLVSRDEIMSTVWPGTAVEEANLTVQISALRRVIDSGRQGQSCIQTVPGRGYRFILSVTRADADDTAASPEPSVQQATTYPAAMRSRELSRLWGLWPAVALSVVALAVLLSTLWPVRTRAPPHLSLVVLPFENLGGDRPEDYLADAITDDLTTELSGVPGMFVVARESAYTYRRKLASVRVIGRELGVRYLVEGSERKLGDVIHVNARLVSTQTGGQLWAGSFDEPVKDLNAGQMQIARWIGETLNVAVVDDESARSRRERPTNPDAFDLIIRARSIALHPMGERENAKIIGLYEHAVRLDPAAVPAMTGLAEALLRASASADARDRAARLIDEAAAADPDNHGVLATTGYLLLHQGRFAEAISAYQRVLELYPNAFYAYNQIGISLIETGRAEEAIPFIRTAIASDPRSPFNWDRYGNLGFALLLLGRDEESIVWTRRALAANLNLAPWIRTQYNLRLAAAYARLGNFEQAHRAIGEADRIWPYDTVRSHWPETPSNVVYVAQIERYQAALRLAGHRDHANEDADFGITSNDTLGSNFSGPTPRIAPGAVTIRTPDLDRLLAAERPIVIDAMSNSWGRSIPGAIGLPYAGLGGATSDAMQERLRATMHELTGGDLSRPVVAVGWNSESFDGRNLALRLVALGYRQVYWYRGGREAWEVAGLPETRVTPRDW